MNCRIYWFKCIVLFTTFVRSAHSPKKYIVWAHKIFPPVKFIYIYTLVQYKCSRARIHTRMHCKYVNAFDARYTLHHQIQLYISLIVNTPQGIRSVMWRAWLFSGAHSHTYSCNLSDVRTQFNHCKITYQHPNLFNHWLQFHILNTKRTWFPKQNAPYAGTWTWSKADACMSVWYDHQHTIAPALLSILSQTFLPLTYTHTQTHISLNIQF